MIWWKYVEFVDFTRPKASFRLGLHCFPACAVFNPLGAWRFSKADDLANISSWKNQSASSKLPPLSAPRNYTHKQNTQNVMPIGVKTGTTPLAIVTCSRSITEALDCSKEDRDGFLGIMVGKLQRFLKNPPATAETTINH